MKFRNIYLSDYQISLARIVAERRSRLHTGQDSRRVLSSDYEMTGILGELAFSQAYLFPVDLSDKPRGDSGIDFRTPSGTIDVKTYLKPFNMIVEVGKPAADILVLAQRLGGVIRLIGWEYGQVLLSCPYRDFGYGVINHYKPAWMLRSMGELERLFLDNFKI